MDKEAPKMGPTKDAIGSGGNLYPNETRLVTGAGILEPKATVEGRDSDFFTCDWPLSSKMITIGALYAKGVWHWGGEVFLRFFPSIVLAFGLLIVFGFQ